jgi:peptidoglycan-associated lipoprotein
VDQSTVDASAQTALDAQADWLIANPEYKVMIEGHADERGTTDYNLALGARRSGSVREYLTLRGVSADRIQTVSYGKERPSELCSAESCYAMNRRGVTVLSNLSF